MCETCGCGEPGDFTVGTPGNHATAHAHDHHDHSHLHEGESHSHDHTHHSAKVIEVNKDILYENNLQAQHNRGFFAGRKIFCINFVSSPGSGKTAILEKTIPALKKKSPVFVIEGDQQSYLDSERIEKTGVPVVQINTGTACHLDARMISAALQRLELKDRAFLFIENVGNLVCPSIFDLGETKRILVMSVTEGDDKPLKYPGMFRSADLCIINKTDLLPYVNFSVDAAMENARKINPSLEFIRLSAATEDGMQEWENWLSQQISIAYQ
jgi:hydrogenase nickel incorporation protein HypB